MRIPAAPIGSPLPFAVAVTGLSGGGGVPLVAQSRRAVPNESGVVAKSRLAGASLNLKTEAVVTASRPRGSPLRVGGDAGLRRRRK